MSFQQKNKTNALKTAGGLNVASPTVITNNTKRSEHQKMLHANLLQQLPTVLLINKMLNSLILYQSSVLSVVIIIIF